MDISSKYCRGSRNLSGNAALEGEEYRGAF
jgi:hypothetical protein